MAHHGAVLDNQKVPRISELWTLYEKEVQLSGPPIATNLIEHLSCAFQSKNPEHEAPVRFVITESNSRSFRCEVGIYTEDIPLKARCFDSIFEFRRRSLANLDRFNSVLIVPTGIGAEVGGHDGDAGAVARLLGQACDTLITHPNVVNASDINELPSNGLYVEGSILTRFMMGTIGLQRVRSNRVLAVLDNHVDELFVNAAINSVNGARATYGLDCPQIVVLDPPIKLISEYAPSGRAVGRVENLEVLLEVLESLRGSYAAVAISSVIRVTHEFHWSYFASDGTMVNPWGGVEAVTTHAVSSIMNIPSAHSPMFESQEISNIDPGVVDPRMAAEAVSLTFLQSILKGLMRAPRVITDPVAMNHHSVLTAADVSCLVIPDGCLGLPTLAALEHGIPVIAVRRNRNIMKNDLSLLPWKEGQFIRVENYLEAVGVMTALKAGLALDSVKRPIFPAPIHQTAISETCKRD